MHTDPGVIPHLNFGALTLTRARLTLTNGMQIKHVKVALRHDFMNIDDPAGKPTICMSDKFEAG